MTPGSVVAPQVLRHPVRTVVITGPDGAGKTTLADEIGQIVLQTGRVPVLWHLRPGILVRKNSTGGPVTCPHSTGPRSLLASVAKLLLVWADSLVGDLLARLRDDPGIVTIIERGWYDMVVDPVRYRLHPRARSLVLLLGRLLPRADVVVVLGGDAEAMQRRKPELSEPEVERQLEAWRRLAARAGRHVVYADTTTSEPRLLAAETWTQIRDRRPAPLTWRRVPLTPRRLAMAWVGDPRLPLQFYRSFNLAATALGPARELAMRRPMGRRVSAPIPLDRLCADLDLRADAAAVIRSSTPGRLVVGIGRAGVLTHVVKLGGPDDRPLELEADMLVRLADHRNSFTVPQVHWTGTWQGRLVLAMEAAPVTHETLPDLARVVRICDSLVSGVSAVGPLVHGDLAPWNIIGTPELPVLIDWERAQLDRLPLLDLAHYVIACGAYLQLYRPPHARALLCEPGGPGWTHLLDVGADPTTAVSLLRAYAESHATRSGPDISRYWRRVVLEK